MRARFSGLSFVQFGVVSAAALLGLAGLALAEDAAAPSLETAPVEAVHTDQPSSDLAALPFTDASMGVFGREGANTRIELFPCEEENLCGRIVWLRRMTEADGSPRKDLQNPEEEARGRELIGLKVLWNLEEDKPGRWKGGRIYNPDDGKNYKARVRFIDDDTVELKACVLVLCETQTWERLAPPPSQG